MEKNLLSGESLAFMFKKIKPTCKKAECGIESHYVNLNFNGKCPMCEAEKEQERQRKERFEAEIDNCLIQAGAGRLFVSKRRNFSITELDMQFNYVLTGKVGAGKTFIALKHLEKFVRCGKKAVYITGYDVASYAKNSFGINEFLEKIRDIDLLVIDEIQEIFNLNDSSLFDNIVDLVYRNDGKFIFLGNYANREEFLKNYSREKYPRIVSRLSSSRLKLIQLESKDRRSEYEQ